MNAQDINRLISGTHADPFAILGRHEDGKDYIFRAWQPGADGVSVRSPRGKADLITLSKIHDHGLFEGRIGKAKLKSGYKLCARYGDKEHVFHDPYRFAPNLGDLDLHLWTEGRHGQAWRALGAHVMEQDGIKGTRFAVWAPNATGVALACDDNLWSDIKHPMRSRGSSGIWELFLPGAGEGMAYKYVIRDQAGHLLPFKADPFGFGAEMRPKSASVVRDIDGFNWQDDDWMSVRGARQAIDAPVSVYEVHLGSWMRGEDNCFLTYAELADKLIPYVKDLGFTHIELMPVTEHPFDGSWGYQPIGLFAPTARFGTPEQFKDFVQACHRAEIGVLLDWVPGHFPNDDHGLAKFDGTHLYEHADLRKGFHPDWNTLIFNFGRREVVNYLVASAKFWLEHYHIDGLRVDAVASMLYLDYSREEGEWVPNEQGGNQNWEAVGFLQRMNAEGYACAPGAMMVAEESTAWPGVTQRTDYGGLGFGYKWNMGWMNDTLEYISEDPVHRKYHHHKMTFGIDYAFSENYILPLSHDEVVHGKGSLIDRMPGDRWQKFAGLRAYFGFMWGHPGKKLLFMGGEFGQSQEWKADQSLDWHLTDYPEHKGVQKLIADLNRALKDMPALYEQDTVPGGFAWVDGGAQDDNVISFLRWDKAGERPVLVVCNFSPLPRHNYRIGVPLEGIWNEVINTDSVHYAGSGLGNLGRKTTDDFNAHGYSQSVELTLPPLSTLILEFEG